MKKLLFILSCVLFLSCGFHNLAFADEVLTVPDSETSISQDETSLSSAPASSDELGKDIISTEEMSQNSSDSENFTGISTNDLGQIIVELTEIKGIYFNDKKIEIEFVNPSDSRIVKDFPDAGCIFQNQKAMSSTTLKISQVSGELKTPYTYEVQGNLEVPSFSTNGILAFT